MKIRASIGLGLSVIAMGGCAEVQSTDTRPMARVRVAHLSPDAPAVDFCLAATGSDAFIGPVLAGAGGLTGLRYAHATKYFDVPADSYQVRLVAPSAADCANSLGGLPDVGPFELASDRASTIAATGKLAHGEAAPFALIAYNDELAPDPAAARLRFIHASPGTGAVDVGLGGGAVFEPVFSNLSYGQTASHDHGYVRTAPLTGAELSARPSGAPRDALAIKPIDLPAGAVATAFAIGELTNNDAPLRVLLCNDGGAPHQLETECAVVGGTPERARIRIAHLSPDAPAVDVCVARSGAGFRAPLLASLGVRVGLAYPQVTEYLELPIDRYNLRVIAATETTCGNPAVPDTNGIAMTAGLTATVAAIGDLERSGAAIADPGFRLSVFVDNEALAAGKGKLRFIHASPGTPNVDVGLGTAHAFVRLFGNVEFGKIAVHGGIDPEGYLEASPFTSTVSARLTGSITDALIIPNVTLPAGQVVTAFAIGNKSGQAVNPLRVLLCADNARSQAPLASCTITP